ncbi:MAG: hypothetical protein JRC99_06435, partial [Deltaproteobacteria bacterium]|nr:hypothetical protein [Deltaproteobacteria bacterium]
MPHLLLFLLSIFILPAPASAWFIEDFILPQTSSINAPAETTDPPVNETTNLASVEEIRILGDDVVVADESVIAIDDKGQTGEEEVPTIDTGVLANTEEALIIDENIVVIDESVIVVGADANAIEQDTTRVDTNALVDTEDILPSGDRIEDPVDSTN